MHNCIRRTDELRTYFDALCGLSVAVRCSATDAPSYMLTMSAKAKKVTVTERSAISTTMLEIIVCVGILIAFGDEGQPRGIREASSGNVDIA